MPARPHRALPRLRSSRPHLLVLHVRTVRIGAHPVVEIEEHRGALRGRLEQIAETAEHVRPDRVALVLGQHEPDLALARVDVEVVEPEVGQDFLQLPLAVDGAQQLLRAELDHGAVGLLLHGIRHPRRLGLRLGLVGCRSLPLSPWPRIAGCANCSEISRELRPSVTRPARRSLNGAVRDPFGMELLVDVRLQSSRPDLLDIARPRAEADAVQDVNDGFVIIRDGGGRHRGVLLVGSEESHDRKSGGERCLEKA